jgi:hypothetical protein
MRWECAELLMWLDVKKEERRKREKGRRKREVKYQSIPIKYILVI